MFTAAFSRKAKIWEQPKYPTMDEWRKKMHIHTVEHTDPGQLSLGGNFQFEISLVAEDENNVTLKIVYSNTRAF